MVHPKDYGTMQIISKQELKFVQEPTELKNSRKSRMLHSIVVELGDNIVDYVITYEEYTECNVDSMYYGDLVMRFTAHYRPVDEGKV